MFKDLIKDIINDINSIDNPSKGRENIVRRCPLCNVEFKVLNIKFPDGSILKIEQCPNCSGLWFDKGELTKALEISLKDIEKFFPSTLGKSIKGSGKRLCPVCSAPMKLINYSMDSNIWVDVCSCGIFLDSGELELIKLYSLNPKTFKVDYIQELNNNVYSSALSSTASTAALSTAAIASSTSELNKNINEIISEVNSLKKDIDELKTIVISKVKNFEQELKNKNIKYLISVYKDPFKQEKIKLIEIKNKIDVLKEKINHYNLNIKDIKEVEDIITLVSSIDKFILTRENSINVRIEELQKEEEKTTNIQNELSLKEQKIDSLISSNQQQTFKVSEVSEVSQLPQIPQTIQASQTLQTSQIQQTSQVQQVSQASEASQDSQTSQVKETKTPIDNRKLNLKIDKIKLNFYTNFLSYFIYNSKIIIIGENKLFLFDLNDFNKDNLNLKEIKISYFSLRFRGVSFIDNKLFIFGNSGQIVVISDLSNLINSLQLNDKNSILFKIGYSDINNIIKFIDNNYLIVTNGKVYVVDSNLKVLQEKSISIVNGINYNNNLIFSNSSGEIIYLNPNLDIDKKISTNSFYAIKNFRIVNNKLFTLSNGFIGYIENNDFKKVSLPKSFIEANDIIYIGSFYFIVGSSGSLFYSYNLIDILDFNSGIYENINSILKINERFMLLLCNSSTLLTAEIL